MGDGEVSGTITPQDNRWTTGPFDSSIHRGKIDQNGMLRFHVWFLRDEPVRQVSQERSQDGQQITFTVTTGERFPPPLVKSLTERGERMGLVTVLDDAVGLFSPPRQPSNLDPPVSSQRYVLWSTVPAKDALTRRFD